MSTKTPIPAGFAAETDNHKEEVLFQVSYHSNLATANVVCYNGTLYNITRIDTLQGYNEDLKPYCVTKKEITKP